MRPSDLDLPVSEFRPLQLEVIQKICNSNKRVTLVEGPPGTGKSIVAIGAARYMGAKKTAVLTPTIQLQEQYLSIPGLAAVSGRKNFDCLVQPTKADEAPCTVCGPKNCEKRWTCPYYKQLDAALRAPISVHNYAFWFLMANGGGAFSDLDLLICDEAHQLLLGDNPIAQAMEVRLVKSTFFNLGRRIPDYSESDYGRWRAWATAMLAELGPDPYVAPEEIDSMSREEVRELNAAKAIRAKCRSLVKLNDDWIIKREPAEVTFGPVWVKDHANQYLFDHAKRTVLLSGTILSAAQFADGLGLRKEEVDFYQLPSTFPPERRPLIIRPVAKVDRHTTPSDEAALVRAIDRILDQHPGEKGLVHTANYKLVEMVMARSRHLGRLMTHTSKDRLAKIDEFRDSGKPLVMLSPSLHTGLDLPYDQLQFQIVLKVPYPNLGDLRIKKRMKEGPDGFPNPLGQAWYSWQTVCTLIQAYGRVMRAEDDAGTTYVIDANFKSLYGRTKGLIPRWVKAAMRWETATERYEEEIDGELSA